jgi:hypothetical protein
MFLVQLELCRRVFLFGYVAIQRVTDVEGSSMAFLSDAFCANCMTGGIKTEQFARYCQAIGSRDAVPQTCK